MWVSSNDSFLLIVCCVKEQNKLCCIIISYRELKLKWINIDRRSGKTMLPFGINDIILISHLSYSGYFQDEAKNESSTRRCLFLGWNQTKTKLTKWLCTFLHRHWEFVKQISLLYFWKGDGNSGPKKKNFKYWWRSVHLKMGTFPFVFWHLLAPLLLLFNYHSTTYGLENPWV